MGTGNSKTVSETRSKDNSNSYITEQNRTAQSDRIRMTKQPTKDAYIVMDRTADRTEQTVMGNRPNSNRQRQNSEGNRPLNSGLSQNSASFSSDSLYISSEFNSRSQINSQFTDFKSGQGCSLIKSSI